MATVISTSKGTVSPSFLARQLTGRIYSTSGSEIVLHGQDSTSYKGIFTGNFSVSDLGEIVGAATGFRFIFKTDAYMFISIEDFEIKAAKLLSLVSQDKGARLLSELLSDADFIDAREFQSAYGRPEVYAYDGHDTIVGSSHNDQIFGGRGRDFVRAGDGDDILEGGNGADELRAEFGDDIVSGGWGNDTLLGSYGNDTLKGGVGNDLLKGEKGRDTLQGDAGKDTMFGGLGDDTFVFRKTSDSKVKASNADIIEDFRQGADVIDLSAIDASTKIKGNNTFTFDGTEAFGTSKQGDIYYQKFNKKGSANDYTMVFIDTDNDTGREMSIKLMGLYNLTADDFIL